MVVVYGMPIDLNSGWVLIPAHNEAAHIASVLKTIHCVWNGPVLVVDSCSTDNTATIAEQHGAVVISTSKPGYWQALRTGYRHLLNNEHCSWVVQLDADGQHNPLHIHRLVGHLSSDVTIPQWVVGSRKGCGVLGDGVLALGQRTLRWMLSTYLQHPYSDISSGMWCLNRSFMKVLVEYETPNLTGDVAIRLFAQQHGVLPMEIPTAMSPRTSGVSMHQGAMHRLKHLRNVWVDCGTLIRNRPQLSPHSLHPHPSR